MASAADLSIKLMTEVCLHIRMIAQVKLIYKGNMAPKDIKQCAQAIRRNAVECMQAVLQVCFTLTGLQSCLCTHAYLACDTVCRHTYFARLTELEHGTVLRRLLF